MASTGRLPEPVVGRSADQMMGRSRDVRWTSVIHVFKIQLTNILNLLWQVTQEFLVNCSSKKLGEQHSGYKNNLNRNKTG